MQWTKAALYAYLSEWSLGLSPVVGYSNAAKGTKGEHVRVFAVSIMQTKTTVFVTGSFLILFIKAT
jgi:hypothetical protein